MLAIPNAVLKKILMVGSISILLFKPSSAQEPFSFTLASLAAGTWSVYIPGHQDDLWTFNNVPSLALYYSSFGIKGYVGLPVKLVTKQGPNQTELAVGDGTFWFGKRVGLVEPRVGLVFPVGYDYKNQKTWIGSGNIQLFLGTGLNPNFSSETEDFEFSGDLALKVNLNDARGLKGGFIFRPDFKFSLRPAEDFKWGLEFLNSIKHGKWSWAPKKSETKAEVVPHLFAEYFLADKISAGTKIGHSIWNFAHGSDDNGHFYNQTFAFSVYLNVYGY